MLRVVLTVATLLCASQAAFAQELTSEQRNACMGDYEKFCKSVTPVAADGSSPASSSRSDKLAPACKKVLEAAEKNRPNRVNFPVAPICGAD